MPRVCWHGGVGGKAIQIFEGNTGIEQGREGEKKVKLLGRKEILYKLR